MQGVPAKVTTEAKKLPAAKNVPDPAAKKKTESSDSSDEESDDSSDEDEVEFLFLPKWLNLLEVWIYSWCQINFSLLCICRNQLMSQK